MKLKVTFENDKKHKFKYVSLSSYFWGKDCSNGPIIKRGDKSTHLFDFKKGDEIIFSTTRFEDEFDLIHKRRGRIVNGVSEANVKRHLAKFKKDRKKNPEKYKIKVLDTKKMSPSQKKNLRRSMNIAKEVMAQSTGKKNPSRSAGVVKKVMNSSIGNRRGK